VAVHHTAVHRLGSQPGQQLADRDGRKLAEEFGPRRVFLAGIATVLVGGVTFGYVGSIASSAIISIVFHTSVSDHGLHVIALSMIAASAVTLLVTVADRRLRTISPQNKENP
jgi:MFS family permease